MKIKNLFRRKETREQETEVDAILKAFLTKDTMNAEKALNIPSVAGSVDFIAGMIAMLPVKLYRENNGKTEEEKDDYRLALLNDETGDLMDPFSAKKEFITDYLLNGRGTIYINRYRNRICSLHYVNYSDISVVTNNEPIFKDADLLIMGERFMPDDFILMTRNSKDGVNGIGIIERNGEILSAAYNALVFEEYLVKRGGNKKGFLQADRKLTEEAITQLKESWRKLYANNEDNMMVLNDGIKFSESSNTSVEMQLNENKRTNAEQICALFNLSFSVICGNANADEVSNAVRTAVVPVVTAFQTALNKSLLLEKEKGKLYFAFDLTELLKGDILKRYQAYQIGLASNFLQIDEVRYSEDLKPLGFNYIKIGLQDVLLDPKTNTIYTPNTSQLVNLGEGKSELPLKNGSESDIMNTRDYIQDPKTGKMNGSTPKNATPANNQNYIDNSNESDIIKKISDCGIVGEIHLVPHKIDVESLTYDSKHFQDKKRNISFEEAKSYIKNARFSVSRWQGQYENYFSDEGASYVNVKSKEIKTSFKRKDFTKSIVRALEVLDKHGK